MKNCFDCKYKSIAFEENLNNDGTFVLISENKDSVLGSMYGKCLNGHTDTLICFFKKYGKKLKSEVIEEEFDCHDYSDSIKILDSCLTAANDILDTLDKIKNKQNTQQGEQ